MNKKVSILRPKFFAISIIGSLLPAIGLAKNKPNIIIIFCDDMGYGDLSCYGSPTISTPNLDKLAYEGQKWSAFYTSESVSSPSRGGLLTGKYGINSGLYGNKTRVLHPFHKGGIDSSTKTIANYLSDAGYSTACVGKWHIGCMDKQLPLAHGFNYFYGIPYSTDMSVAAANIKNRSYKWPLPLYNQHEVVEYEPNLNNITQELTNYATNFIKKKKDEPFFLYLAHPMPHAPIFVNEKFNGKSLRGKYGDAVEEIDWSVGEIMKTLKKYDLDENTLVFFSSDNGPSLINKEEGGSAGEFRDGKSSMFEGGFRVPAIFWGSMVKPSLQFGIGAMIDILPTLCDYASINIEKDNKLDGYSLKKVISNGKDSPREIICYYRGGILHAIRKGSYKLHIRYTPEKWGTANTPLSQMPELPWLYNVDHDPAEKYQLEANYPEIVEELLDLSKQYESNNSKSLFDIN